MNAYRQVERCKHRQAEKPASRKRDVLYNVQVDPQICREPCRATEVGKIRGKQTYLMTGRGIYRQDKYKRCGDVLVGRLAFQQAEKMCRQRVEKCRSAEGLVRKYAEKKQAYLLAGRESCSADMVRDLHIQ
jgi:hypothetical protein